MATIKFSTKLNNPDKWDEFVQAHPDGSLWHSSGFLDVIQKVFGYRSHFIWAEVEEKILGVLPLFSVSSLFWQSPRMIGVPVSTWCGAISESTEIESLLVEKAKELADEMKHQYVELRQIQPLDNDLKQKSSYVTFLYDLTGGKEKLLAKFEKDTRWAIRKAEKNGLIFESDCNDVKLFYELYARSLRDLGTPPYPFEFFVELKRTFGEDALVSTVRKDGKLLSTCFSIVYKDTLYALLAGAERKYLSLNPYSLMMWQLMAYGCNKQLSRFDFGRSRKNTGPYNFKKNWGLPETQLYYQYYLRSRLTVPDLESGSLSTKLFQSTWKMMPMQLVKTIGPRLRKYIVA